FFSFHQIGGVKKNVIRGIGSHEKGIWSLLLSKKTTKIIFRYGVDQCIQVRGLGHRFILLPFIPETFEFDRFLCQKLANLFVENTQPTPGYASVFASTFTNFCGTSYRSIQNAPSIPSERIQYSFHIWLD